MKPYYEDDWVTLYHGDNSEVDAWREADALITDPPYGINYKPSSSRSASRALSGLNGGTATSKDWARIHGDNRPFDPLDYLDFDTVVLFGANHYADQLPPSPGWIVWDKLAGVKSKREFGFNDSADCEIVWTNRKMPAKLYSQLWMGTLRGGRENGQTSVHPTQKPVALMQWIINGMTKPGDLIADPFAGSGSTLIAAKNLGRKIIGVEIEERYCETAAKRLSQQPQALIFDEPAPVSSTGAFDLEGLA